MEYKMKFKLILGFCLVNQVTLVGCGGIAEIQESIDGFTNTTALEAIILGVVPPESDILPEDVVDAMGAGTSFKALVVDADAVAAMEEATPIDDASVWVEGAPMGTVAAYSLLEGLYTLEPGMGLEYTAGETWKIGVMVPGDEDPGEVEITLPEATVFALPDTSPVGQSLTLDLAGQGFHWVFLVVTNALSGEVTFTNENEVSSVVDIYEVTHGESTISGVTIPGLAFPTAGVYAVGVAGMVHQDEDAATNVNTVLSGALAGQMRIEVITIGS
jgi:hypothetical protein